MAIAYSGTNVSDTFTQSTGTRREIVDGVSTSLVSAGWTIISGSGTGDQILESGTPLSGQGSTMKMRIRLWDPGSGNCANIQVQDVNGIFTGAILYLLPAAAKVWYVIACPYQAFIFTASVSTAREFVAFGVPYLPTHLQGVITEAFWGHMNGNSDTDTANRHCFRNGFAVGAPNSAGGPSNQSVYCNGNGWSYGGSGGEGDAGYTMLNVMAYWEWLGIGRYLSAGRQSMTRWHNDDNLLYDTLIGWGLTDKSDEAKIRGQLWDAVISSDVYTPDDTGTFDSHNWQALSGVSYTISSYGSSAVFQGSLLLVTS